MQPRRATLPAEYDPLLRAALKKRGYDLDEPARLAEAVLRLSNFYLENPSVATPWEENWAQAASLVYFFPLNYARCSLVAREARRLGFFEGLSLLVDDGAGMGSGLHAFNDLLRSEGSSSISSWNARDVSPEALQILREINLAGTVVETEVVEGINRRARASGGRKSLLLASYVFTELKDIPREWLEHEALIIVEPSTREDARRLQAEREKLMAAGFSVWAPCTHEEACPLLIHSEKDWCHDRVHFDAPEWFTRIEKHLPMKNRTLTFTYLAARKSLRSPVLERNNIARLVGDTLEEKGKSRQAICRSSEKEMLAWFPQRFEKKEHLEMSRGSLVEIASGLEKKGNELRLRSPTDVDELNTDVRITS